MGKAVHALVTASDRFVRISPGILGNPWLGRRWGPRSL